MTARVTQSVVPRYRSRTGERGVLTHHTLSIGLSVLVLISLSVLGFFYLQQVLQTASRGSDIHQLENRLSELKEQQNALELQSAELRSINTVEQRINELDLVRTDAVSYLGAGGGAVAAATR